MSTKNHNFDYDYFVIGAGSGGVRSARIAAKNGANVGIAEGRFYGGTCVNVGCVPKKLLSYASIYSDHFSNAQGFGWSFDGKPSFSWTDLIRHKDKEIDRLNGIYKTLLKNSDIDAFDDYATFIDDHTVSVGDKKITADKILIAVGGLPTKPDIMGHELAITSDDLFYLPALPRKILIIGGGYIGLEFASILNGMSTDENPCDVTLMYRGDLFLRGFDDDLRTRLRDTMIDRGVNLIFNDNVSALSKNDDGMITTTLESGKTDAFSHVLFATGRAPNTTSLGLDKAGINMTAKGAIPVNDLFQTNKDHIFAAGDVIDRVALTPVAIQEGHFLADYLFKETAFEMSYDNIASAVFTTPPMTSVGLSEQDAVKQGHDLTIFDAAFRPMTHILPGRDERTYMKLIIDSKTDKVLGCHMLGFDSPEIIQMAAIAMTMGATKSDFDRTMALHPCAAEEFVTMRTPSRFVPPQN